MSLDLSGIKDFVENEIMDDQVSIFRDADGNYDLVDAWDTETGTYGGEDNVPPEAFWTGGCYVTGAGTQPQDDPEGGVDVNEEWYYLNIPLRDDVPALQDGDRAILLSSLRNSHMVGVPFRIQMEQLGTFKVKQKVRMRRAAPKALH